MSCDVHHSREYWAQAKRNREVCPFNEEQDSPDLRDTVSETLKRVVDFQRLVQRITSVQQRVASLKADGYSEKEIAAICGLKRGEVSAEMENAKCRILMFQTEDAAMAA